MKTADRVALILAGGSGYRLWPRSTDKTPKQFVHLIGDGTMIQNTYSRISKLFPIEDTYIVTTKELYNLVSEQLPDFPSENIIIEPFPRGTAPCLALSNILLEQKYNPNTVVTVLPSDHIIFNLGEFYESLEIGIRAAKEAKGLVTIGVQPTRPETSFGYVQIKKDYRGNLNALFDNGVRYSTTFAEKPDSATAKRFVESGDFLWNSGIFIWEIATFVSSLEKYWREDYSDFNLLREHINKDSFQENLEYTYKQITSISIDYAVLEKADNVFVVQSTFRWSDVGNWDEIYRLSMKDAKNNVLIGDIIPINTSNCLINSNGKLIGVVGVNDLIVIDSDEALLICKRNCSDDVKEIIDFIRRKQMNRFL